MINIKTRQRIAHSQCPLVKGINEIRKKRERGNPMPANKGGIFLKHSWMPKKNQGPFISGSMASGWMSMDILKKIAAVNKNNIV